MRGVQILLLLVLSVPSYASTETIGFGPLTVPSIEEICQQPIKEELIKLCVNVNAIDNENS